MGLEKKQKLRAGYEIVVVLYTHNPNYIHHHKMQLASKSYVDIMINY